MMELFAESEVIAAVEALPEAYRMAVLLADVEGFAYKEIAEILDVPIGTVMSRLHRGRKALQQELYEFAVARGLVAPTEAESERNDDEGIVDAAGVPETITTET
jgi:RNA polymerase sigma-70 factor, ECF subfamily